MMEASLSNFPNASPMESQSYPNSPYVIRHPRMQAMLSEHDNLSQQRMGGGIGTMFPASSLSGGSNSCCSPATNMGDALVQHGTDNLTSSSVHGSLYNSNLGGSSDGVRFDPHNISSMGLDSGVRGYMDLYGADMSATPGFASIYETPSMGMEVGVENGEKIANVMERRGSGEANNGANAGQGVFSNLSTTPVTTPVDYISSRGFANGAERNVDEQGRPLSGMQASAALLSSSYFPEKTLHTSAPQGLTSTSSKDSIDLALPDLCTPSLALPVMSSLMLSNGEDLGGVNRGGHVLVAANERGSMREVTDNDIHGFQQVGKGWAVSLCTDMKRCLWPI